MSLSKEFTRTEAYAALTRNIYRDAADAPSVGLLKARLAEMMDALLEPGEAEANILFNLFDELYAMTGYPAEAGMFEVFAELAREAAYTYTGHYSASIEAFSQSEKAAEG